MEEIIKEVIVSIISLIVGFFGGFNYNKIINNKNNNNKADIEGDNNNFKQISGDNNNLNEVGVQNIYNNLENKKEIGLTKEAKMLLSKSIEGNKQIKIESKQNKTIIKSGNYIKEFLYNDRENIAIWEGAIKELEDNEFIKSLDSRNHYFEVIIKGYNYYKNKIKN